MIEVSINGNGKVRAVLLNEEEDREVKYNLGSILDITLEISKVLYPNQKNPALIFMEEDVYKHYSMLDEQDSNRVINEILRSYFSRVKAK